MFNDDKKMIAALLGYWAIGVVLLVLMPWLDSSRHAKLWLINIGVLPVLPVAFLLLWRAWPNRNALVRWSRQRRV